MSTCVRPTSSTSTTIRRSPSKAGACRGRRDHFTVTGDLTIRGQTREVTLDVTFNGAATSPFGQSVAGFTAETHINRKDFGLNWNMALEAGGFLVGDDVKIEIELEAVKEDPAPVAN